MSELTIIALIIVGVFVFLRLAVFALTRGRKNNWVDNGTIDNKSFKRQMVKNEQLAVKTGANQVRSHAALNREMELYVPEPASEQEKPKPNNAVEATRKHSTKHRVALYIDGPLSELSDNDGVLLFDILKSLNVSVEATDVSKNFMLKQGVPKQDGKPNLPHLFIDGMAVSDAKTTLDMVKSGELFEWFERGKIDYDKATAEALRNS